MTPKEKAKELFDRFKEEMIENEAYFIDSSARSCALIAVDEIRDVIPQISDIQYYWIDVKAEIQKL
jgi:hypothetical protein